MKFKFLPITTLFFIAIYFLPAHVFAQPMRLCGMTEEGGTNGLGVLFQYEPNNLTYTKKFDFDGGANGSNPYGSLMQASDESVYGMTYAGGANNYGVLFQYDFAGSTYTKKFEFDGATNGGNPRGALMQATDGNFYGMAEVGGANNVGVIFQFNPVSSTYTNKYDFGSAGVSGPVNGQYPYGSLTQASDGNLYGMTSGGGSNQYGVLFQFNPVTSTYTKKVDFAWAASGAYPYGSLVKTADGNLYGMTYQGGTAGQGVLFQYNPATSTFTKKIDFGAIGGTGTTKGISPNGSLIQGSDGTLYGMTYEGGANNLGVIFSYDLITSTYTKLFDFDGANLGGNPYGSLMEASDGNLYGMTKSGGANGYGVLFQFIPYLPDISKQLDFAGTNGKYPMFSNLIELALTTGINKFSPNDNVSLSPNPASDQITIKTSSHTAAGTVTVSIINVLGGMIQEDKLIWSDNIRINVKDLQAGIYFIQMKTEKENIVKRFVKK